jgi:hypothetical protein
MKLSPTQSRTLEVVYRNGGKLVRRSGGFWTYPGCAEGKAGIPEFWIGVQTVRALETKGLLKRTHESADEWNDPRVLNYD